MADAKTPLESSAAPAAVQPQFTVVGIGASAGGLAALKQLLPLIPPHTGLAWVIVVHLSPEHESHLAELLQPHVALPVHQVTKTVELHPDRVYVIPPNANLNAIDTHLRLSPLEDRPGNRATVDHFFRTLSKAYDGHAIGIVLTGTGSDGALGLKDIKERGGLTVVQDPAEAEYDGMPRSAISTGLVDLVLPVAEIPVAVIEYARTQPQVRGTKRDSAVEEGEHRLVQRIFTLIRTRTSRDFSRYKRSTIMRRIARRMQLHHVEELEQYLGVLQGEDGEVEALADDLLITVTRFFRDPEVFAAIENLVIPRLFDNRSSRDEIRVWSAGCATGEEAYSLAMLLLEEAARHDSPPRLQLFATDLHEQSLRKAREGFYPGDIEADVTRERIDRFFRKQDGGYRIRSEVRDVVVFSPHDLLGDPPFSRLDLIACRNLLIYLDGDVQQEVLELFHYALSPDGFLLLGTAEQAGDHLFQPEDREHRIYRRRNVPARQPRLPVFPLSRRQPAEGDFPTPRRAEGSSYGDLHQRMVERSAPPSLLLNGEDRVVHVSQHAGRYLRYPGGEPNNLVRKLLRAELLPEFETALHQVRDHGEPVRTRRVEFALDGTPRSVALDVRPPRHDEDAGFVLVLFDEGPPLARDGAKRDRSPDARGRHNGDGVDEPGASPGDEGIDRRVHALEAERDVYRDRLQALVERHEADREEMTAANEELQSTNEELRSTMEELETSKEELQSLNEELQALNQENRHKVDELGLLSADLQNLLTSTDIATLFLDRQLRILRFTPKVEELFHVRAADRGRAAVRSPLPPGLR